MSTNAEDTKPFRVIMWCVPRSISTAITKCFSFIDNTQVWFEPFCLAFFQEFGMKAGGMHTMPATKEEYVAIVKQAIKGTPMEDKFKPEEIDFSILTRSGVGKELDALGSEQSVFIKDMAYGATDHLDKLPSKESGFRHTFLIRDPERMFPSWRNLLLKQLNTAMIHMTPGGKGVDDATFDLTRDPTFMMPGYTYKCQYDLWRYVREQGLDPEPIVVDVDELVAHPEVMMPKYFRVCGMPWDEGLLQWDASPAVADEWKTVYRIDPATTITHANALSSSNFRATGPKLSRSEMKPDVIKAIDETKGYYKEMAQSRITAT